MKSIFIILFLLFTLTLSGQQRQNQRTSISSDTVRTIRVDRKLQIEFLKQQRDALQKELERIENTIQLLETIVDDSITVKLPQERQQQ